MSATSTPPDPTARARAGDQPADQRPGGGGHARHRVSHPPAGIVVPTTMTYEHIRNQRIAPPAPPPARTSRPHQ